MLLILGTLVLIGRYTIGSLGSQAFGFGLKLHHLLSQVSHLQMADYGTS